MKQILTHNENIKFFKDISHHVELEADCIVANQTAEALLTEANPCKTSGFKRNKGDNGAPKQGKNNGEGSKSAPKKNAKHRRGKKRGTNKVKCFNCQKKGHFAGECTEPKKVTNSLTFSNIRACSHVLVAHSLPDWIVDTGATKHVARDWVGCVDYRHLGSLTKVNLQLCEPCLAGKACRKPFGTTKRAAQPIELVHSDIC